MRVLSFDVGLRHLAYADVVQAGADGSLSLERWGVIDVTGGARMAPDALTTALVEALDADFYDPGSVHYDHVLIENQPSRKNPAMKAVQVAIHAYFATLRLHTGCVGVVRPVSASQKLGVALSAELGLQPPVAQEPAQQVKTAGAAYRERKARSVELCRLVIASVLSPASAAVAEETLRAAKKKDDLSDALLQAVWFLRCSRPKALSTPIAPS